MTENLKPCPFCGAQAELISMRCEYAGELPPNAQERDTYVWCPMCGFQAHTWQTDKEAIDAWNTRQLEFFADDLFHEMYSILQEIESRYDLGDKELTNRIQSILARIHPAY